MNQSLLRSTSSALDTLDTLDNLIKWKQMRALGSFTIQESRHNRVPKSTLRTNLHVTYGVHVHVAARVHVIDKINSPMSPKPPFRHLLKLHPRETPPRDSYHFLLPLRPTFQHLVGVSRTRFILSSETSKGTKLHSLP